MSSILKNYTEKRDKVSSELDEYFSKDNFVLLQELDYRISVFRSLQALFKGACMMSAENYIGHLKMLDGYVSYLPKERNYASPDNRIQERRSTALKNLNSVIADFRKRFSQYDYENSEKYARDAHCVISNIISVWIAYRNTYIEIKEN